MMKVEMRMLAGLLLALLGLAANALLVALQRRLVRWALPN